ncbi:MAG TPA: DUF58 domain-containing protein [Burkholderiales bacterium]|jgi:uncharacterized protein (DUF58 family)
MAGMKLALPSRLAAWLAGAQEPAAGPVRLTQRRVYVLPSRGGLLLGLTLLLMLMGCINYNLGLGYVLTFLLAGVALVAMLHTFRNLAQLEVLPGRAEPVFAGEAAVFSVLLRNPTRLARFSVAVAVADPTGLGAAARAQADWRDLPAGETVGAEVRLDAVQRGRLPLPRLCVFTTFPLGLFHVWSNVYLDMSCLVYPRTETGDVPLPPAAPGDAQGGDQTRGQEDFAGLRRYQPGDSPRHVAWKALARGQDVVTKQFTGTGAGDLWLSWSQLPADMRVEARLSRLARWVLDAAQARMPFGLEIPGVRLAVGAGRAHEEACLSALALFRER